MNGGLAGIRRVVPELRALLSSVAKISRAGAFGERP